MKVGFCTYSLPLKWWDQTVIAHNKIFAYIVDSLHKQGHSIHVQTRVDFNTQRSMAVYGTSFETPPEELDVLFVFCGPHMPFNEDSITFRTLATIRRFKGRVVYVSCDYLLQFDFHTRRYGALLAGWPQDAFTDGKTWRYVTQGTFENHFKTLHQQEKILEFMPRDAFYSCEMNQAGLPMSATYKLRPKPSIDLLYCGAFRKDRSKYFEKYFCAPEASAWTISTSKGNMESFKSLKGFKAALVNPFPTGVCRFINNTYAQIIFHDVKDVGAPLPTRYWEAVAAQSVVVFDASFTLPNDLGYDPPVVNSATELSDVIQRLKTDNVYRAHLIKAQNALIVGFEPYADWGMAQWLK